MDNENQKSQNNQQQTDTLMDIDVGTNNSDPTVQPLKFVSTPAFVPGNHHSGQTKKNI